MNIIIFLSSSESLSIESKVGDYHNIGFDNRNNGVSRHHIDKFAIRRPRRSLTDDINMVWEVVDLKIDIEKKRNPINARHLSSVEGVNAGSSESDSSPSADETSRSLNADQSNVDDEEFKLDEKVIDQVLADLSSNSETDTISSIDLNSEESNNIGRILNDESMPASHRRATSLNANVASSGSAVSDSHFCMVRLGEFDSRIEYRIAVE